MNVVIYLTPYIVRKSGDLERLRNALNELESIQTKYNAYVRKGLDQEAGYEEGAVTKAAPAASRRIRRTHTSNLSILDKEE